MRSTGSQQLDVLVAEVIVPALLARFLAERDQRTAAPSVSVRIESQPSA
jgi:hypothetical protein